MMVAEDTLHFKLDDFKTQLGTRVTRDYINLMGKQIRETMIDTFDRKNEDTLESLRQIVNEIGVSQEQLTLDTKTRLKDYRAEISLFKKELNEKAFKVDFKKCMETMQQN